MVACLPIHRRLLEGIIFLVAALLLLLSLDWQANLLLSRDSFLPPAPAFCPEGPSVNTSKVQNFSERMASRQARIQEVCKRHNASLSWDVKSLERSRKKHIWDVVNHLVFCPIAKVASTTWISNFLAWSKIDRTSVPLVLSQMKEAGTIKRGGKEEVNWEGKAGGEGIRTLARYIYQAPEASNLEELTSQFKENTGFLLVRHPLVRLVSAYEDKMLNPHPFPYAYHHRVQEEIKSGRGGRKVEIDYPEDLLQSKRIRHLLKKKVVTMGELLTQPSFPEFVDWLVKNRAEKGDSPSSWAGDIAWVPFYTVCPVCQLPYTVLKLENPEETEEMLEQLNLKLPQWATPVHTVGGTSSSASKAKRYYGELTRRQVESLVQIFHLDLLLFGYNAQDYLDLAKKQAS